MEERRKSERYHLELPAEIQIGTSENRKETRNLVTSDVSVGGAFLISENSIPKGTRISLKVTLPAKWLKRLTRAQGQLEVVGTVLRSDPEGIAVCFDEDPKFSRIE